VINIAPTQTQSANKPHAQPPRTSRPKIKFSNNHTANKNKRSASLKQIGHHKPKIAIKKPRNFNRCGVLKNEFFIFDKA